MMHDLLWNVLRRKIVLTQGNAGATDAVCDVTLDNSSGVLIVDALVTGPDDYAAARALTVQVLNADDDVVENVTPSVNVDNQRVHHAPVVPTAAPAATDDVARRVGGEWVLYGGDVLRISAAALAQNETLTVYVRARTTSLTAFTSASAGVTRVESEA